MTSEVSVTLDIPTKAIDILKILQYQNHTLDFKINKATKTITLTGYIVDSNQFAETWDSLPSVDEYLRKGV